MADVTVYPVVISSVVTLNAPGVYVNALAVFNASQTVEKEGALSNVVGDDWAVIRNAVASYLGYTIDTIDKNNTSADWYLSGTNTVATEGDLLHFTYVDNDRFSFAYVSENSTTIGLIETKVGLPYKIRFRAKVKVGTSVGILFGNVTSQDNELFITNTELEWFEFNFVARDPSLGLGAYIQFRNATTGNEFWIENQTIELTENTPTVILRDTPIDFPRVDYSERLADLITYGENIVINGSFDNWTTDNPDNWIVTGESGSDPMVSEVAGTCRLYTSSASLQIRQVILTIGKEYLLELNVTANPEGTYKLGSTSGGIDIGVLNSVGAKSFTFTALGTSLSIQRQSGAGDDITIDNISVKEIISTYNGNPKVLVENAATTEVKFSEDFTHNDWLKSNITVSNELGIAAPDGTFTAERFVNNGGGYVFQGTNLVTGQIKSIYARTVSGTGNYYLLGHNSEIRYLFALTEEWQRFSIDVIDTETGGGSIYAWDSRAGDTGDILVWGANGTDAPLTSYIQNLTISTAVTRPADDISIAPPVGTTLIQDKINGKWYDITNIPTSFKMQDGTEEVVFKDAYVPYKNLIKNSRFDSDTIWLKGVINWTISNGVAIYDGLVTGYLFSESVLGIGKTYLISVDVIDLNDNGSIQITSSWGAGNYFSLSLSEVGTTVKKVIVAGATTLNIYGSSAQGSGVIDNVEVFEIPSWELYPQNNAASIIGEVDAVTGWIDGNGSATMASVVSDLYHGSFSLELTTDGAGLNRYWWIDFTTKIDYTYYFEFWAKRGAVGMQQLVLIYGLEGGTKTIFITSTIWAKYTISGVALADGANNFRLYTNSDTNIGTEAVYIDAISIIEIPAAELYPSGNSASKYAPEAGVGDWVSELSSVIVSAELDNGDHVIKVKAIDGSSDRASLDFSVTNGKQYTINFEALESANSDGHTRSPVGLDGLEATYFTESWASYNIVTTANITGLARLRMYAGGNADDYILFKNFSIVETSSPDVTINATTINTAIALLAPTVTGESGTVNAEATPTVISVVSAIIAPTITGVQNAEITPGVISAVVDLISPVVTAQQNIEITPAVINAAVTVHPVVISSAGNAQVNAVTINTVATVLDVTVITTQNATITPAVLQSVVQVLVPTVLAQRNVQINAVLIQAGITILDPTVVIITDEDFVKIYVDMQLVKTVQVINMELVKTIKTQKL